MKERIPLIEELQEACPTKYELREIRSCELVILNDLQFELKSLTVFDFCSIIACSCGWVEKNEDLVEIIDTAYSGNCFGIKYLQTIRCTDINIHP